MRIFPTIALLALALSAFAADVRIEGADGQITVERDGATVATYEYDAEAAKAWRPKPAPEVVYRYVQREPSPVILNLAPRSSYRRPYPTYVAKCRHYDYRWPHFCTRYSYRLHYRHISGY